jgi:hypothetical protein
MEAPMTIRNGLQISAALILPLMAACEQPAPAQEEAVTRDSSGVRIIDNAVAAVGLAPFRISDQPIYRVGWGDGHIFEAVVAGTLLPDGRAVFADGGSTLQVTVLSPDGEVESVLGRPGEGPGEFRRIFSVQHFDPDTVIIQDSQNRRLSFFHEGSLVRDIGLGSAADLCLLGSDEDGRLLLGMPLAVVRGRRYETPWLQVPIVTMTLASPAFDTVGVADWDQSLNFGGNNPFGSRGHATISNGRFVVGRSDIPELRWFDSGGQLQQIARWQAEPRSVSDSVWAAYEAGIRARFSTVGLPEADIRSRIETLKAAAAQEPPPLFGGLLGDDQGNVWIAEYRSPYSGNPPRGSELPSRYSVLAPDGRYVGHVAMPASRPFRLLAVSLSRVIGIEEDEFGVQAVVAYGIER